MVEKVIEVDNAILWTDKRGNGNVPAILISGGPGTCNYMEPVSNLIENFCEVIMFDPRGCGRSSYDLDGYDLQTCIEDLESIRQAYGYKKWMVIGHSWGADLGLAYSLLYPDSLLGFVSISGTGIQNDRDWKNIYNQNKAEKGEKLPEFEYPYNKIVHRSLIDSWRSFIKSPSLLQDISQIDLPSLFIFAEKDMRPSWPIQQISNLIKHSNYIELKDVEHYMWLDKENELGNVLSEFINNFLE